MSCKWLYQLTNIHLYMSEVRIGLSIQLFRERLSEKVHATIPKVIVGIVACTFLASIFLQIAVYINMELLLKIY